MIADETARILLGHNTKGWSVDEIADLIMWIETGDEQYRRKPPEDAEKKQP